jgi:hypothetical protein
LDSRSSLDVSRLTFDPCCGCRFLVLVFFGLM